MAGPVALLRFWKAIAPLPTRSSAAAAVAPALSLLRLLLRVLRKEKAALLFARSESSTSASEYLR